MKKMLFYHAGCPVCRQAEDQITQMFDSSRFDLEMVHLGTDRSRIVEAEQLGVASVPALVVNNQVLHINFGAALSELK